MKSLELTLVEMEIYEADAFREADIVLLDYAKKILHGHRFLCFPESKGIARLINLVHWDVDARREYVDGTGIHADQVIHLAVHHVLSHLSGSDTPHAMLFAECLASATDLYLVGKLARVGHETDFVRDTLESFGMYYDMYAGDENAMETLITSLVDAPFQAMVRAADYLYRFGGRLLNPTVEYVPLRDMESHYYYPLTHHYNMANWMLTIRARFPGPTDVVDLGREWSWFCRDEPSFLAYFRELADS